MSTLKTWEVLEHFAMLETNNRLRTLKSWCKRYPESGKALTQLFLELRRKRADDLRNSRQWGPQL